MDSATRYCLRGFLWWVLLLAVSSTVDAIDCYNCQLPGPTEGPCVSDPATVLNGVVTNCTGQCYWTHQVRASDQTLHFVKRGCDEDNKMKNEDIPGDIPKTIRVCSTDLCNDKNLTYVPDPTDPPITGPTTTPNPNRFRCYSCVYSYGDSRDCIDNPTATVTTPVFCEPPNYCSIFSQYLTLEKHVRSFQRGCRPRSGENNGCTEDSQFNTCLTLCPTNLCNTGDGSDPPPDSFHPTPPTGRVPALLGSTILLMLTSICTLMFTV